MNDNKIILDKLKGISLSLLALLLILLFSTCYAISYELQESIFVTSLDRPNDGSSYKTYDLIANTKERDLDITVNVPKKHYSSKQAFKLFGKYELTILKTILDKNEDITYIDKPLNLISSIGEEKINLSYILNPTNLVGNDGSLVYENISENGSPLTLEIHLKLDKYEAVQTYSLTVYRPKLSDKELFQKNLQSYIDSSSNASSRISLPNKVLNKDVHFENPSTNYSLLFLAVSILCPFLLNYLNKRDTLEKVKKRNEELLNDYSDFVSKLLLLSNAGMNIKNSLTKMLTDSKESELIDHYAYKELGICLNEISNGKSEAKSYSDFGKRIGVMPYIKLGSLLSRNITLGSKELNNLLNRESKIALEEKKALALTASKKAETKMIFPMLLILIMIMGLIIVPSFISF